MTGPNELAAAYHRFAVSVARRALRNHPELQSEAEDVANLGLYEAFRDYDPALTPNPATRVAALVRWRAMDLTEEAGRDYDRLPTVPLNEAYGVPDEPETPDAMEGFEHLIAGLPERDARILRLIHVEGFTQADAGKPAGLSPTGAHLAARRAYDTIRPRALAMLA